MTGVGEKSERTGGDAATDLGEHEEAGDERSEPHTALVIGISYRPMRMAGVAMP